MHSGHVACPAEVMLKYGSFNAGEKCPWEHIVVDYVVLPIDVKDSSEPHLLEPLQMFDILDNTSMSHKCTEGWRESQPGRPSF